MFTVPLPSLLDSWPCECVTSEKCKLKIQTKNLIPITFWAPLREQSSSRDQPSTLIYSSGGELHLSEPLSVLFGINQGKLSSPSPLTFFLCVCCWSRCQGNTTAVLPLTQCPILEMLPPTMSPRLTSLLPPRPCGTHTGPAPHCSAHACLFSTAPTSAQ